MSQAESPPSFDASRVKGKTFVLARRAENSLLEEAASLIARFGGRLLREVMPGLDYLVVLDQQADRPTAEERDVAGLAQAGEAITVLNRHSFRELFSPTPEEALALLRGGEEGLEQWRLRRNDGSQTPIDLSGADLRGEKLDRIVLYRVKLDGADLSDTDLSESCLGELVRVNLNGARLQSGCVFHLTDCSVRHADLSHVRLNPAEIVRTDFTGASLREVEGSYTRSEQAVFREADLTGARLQDSTFPQADFDGANLTQALVDRCDLSGATFKGANLSKASLSRARLVDADLTSANLAGANLAGADLTGATIEGADFHDANLYGANLSALGPGEPLRLTRPPAVALERIGPNMRRLDALWQETGSLETSMHIDPDGSEADFVQLVVSNAGRSIRAFSARNYGSRLYVPTGLPEEGQRYCQAENLCEAMLELAQRWAGAVLYLETLRLRSGNRETRAELRELSLAAWHEAFALPLPSPADRKATQAAHRKGFVAMLRGGSVGIAQWNELSSEVLTRAGQFRRVDLANCDLQGANLGNHLGSSLGGLDFEAANFAGVNLKGGSLYDCSLIKSSFRNAVLDGITFAGANLRRADFEGASLKGCNLRGTRCRGVNFQGADLRKADLSYADLRGADLSTAQLEGTRFEGTKYDATTRFPEGFEVLVKPVKGPAPQGLEVGSRVRVIFGTFANMEGQVMEVSEPAGTCLVELTVFGRAIPVELEFGDVELV